MPKRSGNPDGDTATVASGDSDTTLTTVFETPDSPGSVFETDTVIVDYSGGATTQTTLEVHDADTSDAAGDLDADTLRLPVELSAGDRVVLTGVTLRDFQKDVIVDPDGSQDGDIQVTVGGRIVTGQER